MTSHAQRLISVMTHRIATLQSPEKIMKVRERNVDFGLGKRGVLKRVMGKRFTKNGYTHIQLRGVVHKASISRGIFDSLIVWIESEKN